MRHLLFHTPALAVQPWRSRLALGACAVIIGLAGCDDYTVGLTPTTPTAHVLRIQGSGGGSGTVTAPEALPGLSCTITSGALAGLCASGYPTNAAVSLVATPTGESVFAGWSGACTGTDGCVVDMSQERTVTAAFARGNR